MLKFIKHPDGPEAPDHLFLSYKEMAQHARRYMQAGTYYVAINHQDVAPDKMKLAKRTEDRRLWVAGIGYVG
jgi:hypothetical protein